MFCYACSAACLFEQKSSDITASSDMNRGFTSAVMLPVDQGLLCVTADQQFLFYAPVEQTEGMFKLALSRRLIGYNEEIVDMRFLGEEEKLLAVATNLEQVICNNPNTSGDESSLLGEEGSHVLMHSHRAHHVSNCGGKLLL